MVYTVTLNPALDCYVSPEEFAPGRDLRYSGCRFLPGGKGVNVSLLLRSLGVKTKALGLAGGFTGRELAALLEERGLPTGFVFLEDGLTRVNIKITPPGQPETALNGSGPEIPPEALERLEERLGELEAGDFLVLAGSLPASLPAGTYARLAGAAPPGVEAVIDASGPALLASAAARPFLMKPNREELAEAFGEPASTLEEAAALARKLQGLGARNVAVTLGGEGALLLDEAGGARFRPAVPGTPCSAVGAGDSFVAGFLYGWSLDGGLDQALDWAVSAGAATAFREGVASGEEVRAVYRRAFGRSPTGMECPRGAVLEE